ncbi:hypothetical protein ACE2AJ_14970 [Aquihabitans daechungensis]|uniref:hypothetical protein n=1 Tax=Aquihabitans daechungensis TaxID=1052257 RepID=UPI003BA0C4CF
MKPVHATPDGDDTRIDVRMVLAPIAGTFHPGPVGEVTTEGELVERGGVIGHIAGPGREAPVTSFCTGFLVRLLAEPGERVRADQPVAWLHPVDRPTTHPRAAA